MYAIDPDRTDLVDEFWASPGGPYSPELTLLVNALRLLPMEQRHILVCTRRGREWAIARMPGERGARLEYVEGGVFSDFTAASREVFRLRWQTATGRMLNRDPLVGGGQRP